MHFDVLSKDLSINAHFLVEASAGTGKTFTIEHLFIRRLLERDAEGAFVDPSKIAVLTFTKAVARELSLRIARALDKTIQLLQQQSGPMPEYIAQVVESGMQQEALKRVKLCRITLEQAFIGTIHSFCMQVINDWHSDSFIDSYRQISDAELEGMVNDFFREEFGSAPLCDPFDKVALEKTIRHYKNDFAAFRVDCIKTLWEPIREPIQSVLDIPQLFSILHRKILDRPLDRPLDEPLEALPPYQELVACYTGCCTKNGEIKEELYKALSAFSAYIQEPENLETKIALINKPLYASDWFSKPKVKKEISAPVLHCVAFLHSIEPTLRALAEPKMMMERIRKQLLKYVTMRMERECLFSFKALLNTMDMALKQESFKKYLQDRFSCLIVDEFQDTDPVQWDIIKTLFLERDKTSLYLVGDPKQAIYAFRSADVYSYMEAKNTLLSSPYVLTKNFRSSPRLLAGLNMLFTGAHADKLFYLPKLDQSIVAPQLSSGSTVQDLSSDEPAIVLFEAFGSIGKKRHWPTPEVEELLFSFIASEIKKHPLPDSSTQVILVKDRYQLERIENYLKVRGISVNCTAKKPIAHTIAHTMLKKLFEWVAAPRSKKALVAFLVQPPLSYSQSEVERFFVEQDEALGYWAEHVSWIVALKKLYEERGVFHFFEAFLHTPWVKNGVSIKQLLLSFQGGLQVLRDLETLFSYISLETNLAAILDKLAVVEDVALYSMQDIHKSGVRLMTLHAAKGLEFDVVFALGLASRHLTDSDTIEEVNSEKSRLFYVAATRAKQKLYIPFATALDTQKINPKAIAPSELFSSALKSAFQNASQGASQGASQVEFPLKEFCDKAEGIIKHIEVKNIVALPEVKESICYKERPRSNNALSTQMLRVTSFSSAYSDLNLFEKAKIVPELPLGAHVGTVLHALLQKICLLSAAAGALLDQARCEAFIQQTLFHTFLDAHCAEIQTKLWQAFHVPLVAASTSFTLQEILWDSVLCEAEFLVQNCDDSLQRGVVDLVFEYKGLWYLLDWKSNWIEQGYCLDSVRQTVHDCGYDMQASLYSRAFEKTGRRFGGFFFIFIRCPASGVLFLSPEEVFK